MMSCLPIETDPKGFPATKKIAALFVKRNGVYSDIPEADCWDLERDARRYSGPYPIVAHPPCQRWGKFWAGQPLYIKQTGLRKVKGDDDGCFLAALTFARLWGGIIEHPWGSHAWRFFDLNIPARTGGWEVADAFGGWTCCVEQGRYGHYARKPTLLLAYHAGFLPNLDWGVSARRLDPELVNRIGIEKAKRRGEVAAKGGGRDSVDRIETPPKFRNLLISIAKSSRKVTNSV